MADFHVNGERLWNALQRLAELGATQAGGAARVASADTDNAGQDQLVEWASDW